MWNVPEDQSRIGVYAKNAKKAALAQVAIGVIGILYPLLVGKLTITFLSLLLLAGGLALGYFTYITQSKDPVVIRKSILLIILAFMMNLSGLIGVLTLAAVLGLYFFGEAIINTQLSKHLKHDANKYWLLAAVVALILGIFILMFLPHHLIYLLGSFIGVTYLFNALALYQTAKVFEAM
jgi:uncharacterized membrane protein HdeD (DUF308 family)